MKTLYIAPLLATLLLGCQPAEDSTEDAPPPKKEFVGEIKKEYVGAYKSEDSRLTLTLEASGDASMVGTIMSPGGEKKVDTKMNWKMDKDTLLFQDDKSAVTGYKAELKGSTLTLKTSKAANKYTKIK